MSGRVGLREDSRAAQQLARQITRVFIEAGWRPRHMLRADQGAMASPSVRVQCPLLSDGANVGRGA